MKEKRKFKRFPAQLSARCLVGSEKEWLNCSIINISRDGMGIEVRLQERIPPDLILKFKIIIPEKVDLIETTGILKWVKELKEEMGFVGGVELFNIDSEEARTLLDYANENLPRKEKK